MSDPKPAKILMIEDNESHRFMYDFQFKKLGYANFKAVGTAQAGFESIKQDTPDVILLDLVLEDTVGLDGLAILRQLKQDPATTHVPVIILSNKRETDMSEEVKKAGAVDYILKAKYLPKEIVERVETFLMNQT